VITLVSPHPDDAEIGASMFLGPNSRIVLITGDSARYGEQAAASVVTGTDVAAAFGWAEGRCVWDAEMVSRMEPFLRESDTVLSPPVADTHQDHRAVAYAVRSALRRSPVTLLEYETPSTTAEWNPNVFVPMTDDDIERQDHILSKFRSQSDRLYFDRTWLRSRARVHGLRVGGQYAQAFRLVTTGAPLTREG
jgi:LmbE family N-acetylglucosaminyl deacetylase